MVTEDCFQNKTQTLSLKNKNRKQATEILWSVITVWLLGYYLLSKSLFERISPGGLIMERFDYYPHWLVLGATIALSILALLALTPIFTSIRESSSLPLWLLTSFLFIPVLLDCLRSGTLDTKVRSLESLLITISVGIIGAAITSKICNALVIGASIGLIESLYTIIYQRENVNTMVSGILHRAGGTFNDTNSLYTLMIVVLPFSFLGAIKSKNTILRTILLFASAAEFTALLLSASRGGMLGAGIALTLLVYMTTKSKSITSIVLICAIILTVSIQSERTSGNKNYLSTQRSNISRSILISDGWKAFTEHPLYGMGVNSFNVPWENNRGNMRVHNTLEEPKNLFLSWLAERGICGGILFCLIAWITIKLIRQSALNPITIATSAAWVGLLVAGMVDTPFGPPSRYVGNCCFGFLLGMTAWLPAAEFEEVK